MVRSSASLGARRAAGSRSWFTGLRWHPIAVLLVWLCSFGTFLWQPTHLFMARASAPPGEAEVFYQQNCSSGYTEQQTCKAPQDVRENVDPVFLAHQDAWVKQHKGLLTVLVHRLLGRRTRTHVLTVETDYRPRKKEKFQITDWDVVSLTELQLNPSLYQRMVENMETAQLKVQDMGEAPVALGYMILSTLGFVELGRIMPLGVELGTGLPKFDPEQIIKAINMGLSV